MLNEHYSRQLLFLGIGKEGQEKIDRKMVIFIKDGRALIHGTKDLTHAKAIYQRILG